MSQIELSRSDALKLMTIMGKESWFIYSILRLLAKEDAIVTETQACLAEYLGVSEKTVSRHISSLSSITVQDKPLVKVEKHFDGNVYSILEIAIGQNCLVPIYNNTLLSFKDILANGQPATKKERKLNDTDIIFNYFCDQYQNRYNESYRVSNFAREKGQVKNLIKKYGGDIELLKGIIDVTMRLYDQRWKSAKFNRPTIGALLSWIAAQVEPFAKANLEKSAEQDEFENIEITVVDGENLLAEYERKGWI